MLPLNSMAPLLNPELIFKHIHIILMIVFVPLDVPSHHQLSEESTSKNGAEIAHIHCHHG
jgi:hypothetical protein